MVLKETRRKTKIHCEGPVKTHTHTHTHATHGSLRLNQIDSHNLVCCLGVQSVDSCLHMETWRQKPSLLQAFGSPRPPSRALGGLWWCESSPTSSLENPATKSHGTRPWVVGSRALLKTGRKKKGRGGGGDVSGSTSPLSRLDMSASSASSLPKGACNWLTSPRVLGASRRTHSIASWYCRPRITKPVGGCSPPKAMHPHLDQALGSGVVELWVLQLQRHHWVARNKVWQRKTKRAHLPPYIPCLKGRVLST